MKAGKLVHTIEIQKPNPDGISEAGTPITVWQPKITLRAEIIERSTEEFLRSSGAADEATIIFRTRFVDRISNADRIFFEDQAFNIREISQIGRRNGLELRCVALEDG